MFDNFDSSQRMSGSVAFLFKRPDALVSPQRGAGFAPSSQDPYQVLGLFNHLIQCGITASMYGRNLLTSLFADALGNKGC